MTRLTITIHQTSPPTDPDYAQIAPLVDALLVAVLTGQPTTFLERRLRDLTPPPDHGPANPPPRGTAIAV